MSMFAGVYLLACSLMLWIPSLSGTCSEHRVFDLAFKNSISCDVPSAEKHHTSEMECATLCYNLYSEKCTAFFYNTHTSSCSIYNSSLSCVKLHHQPGIMGYAYVKHQSDALVECVGVGIRPLCIFGQKKPVFGYYDREGWLVIQRRTDGSEDFNRTWVEYENGFGNLTNEFWLGNKYIHALTSQTTYEIQFDLETEDGRTGYRRYNQFSISDAQDKYRLKVGTAAQGDLADSFGGPQTSNQFSTKDADHDGSASNVAHLVGAGWWYANWGDVYLNGREPCGGYICNVWVMFDVCLIRTQMKIRPA